MTLLRYELFMATEDDGGGRTAFLGANYMNWLLYKLRPFNSWSEDERIRAAIDVLVGLADDGLHAPNEKFNISHYYNGIRSVARLLDRLGEL